MPSAATKLSMRADPKRQVILDRLKDVPGFELAQNEVLVAIYQRDEKTPGGIVLTSKTLKEDVYQGKVGLVVKIGANFKWQHTDPFTGNVGGIPVQLHDWVVFRPSDTWSLEINIREGVFEKDGFVVCRTLEAKHIRAVVENPDMVW